jgi:hypothetical protein
MCGVLSCKRSWLECAQQLSVGGSVIGPLGCCRQPVYAGQVLCWGPNSATVVAFTVSGSCKRCMAGTLISQVSAAFCCIVCAFSRLTGCCFAYVSELQCFEVIYSAGRSLVQLETCSQLLRQRFKRLQKSSAALNASKACPARTLAAAAVVAALREADISLYSDMVIACLRAFKNLTSICSAVPAHSRVARPGPVP